MSLAVLADHMASKGRGPDSMLIHMSPREVQGLQALAENHGGSLTINPETGLPEAGVLDKLLPTIIGAGLSMIPGVGPLMAAGIVGGIQTVRTGDIGKGLAAGLGAYGGANLTSNLSDMGSSAIGAESAAAGLTMTPELAAELQIAGEGAKDTLLQQQVTDRMAAATPFEKLSYGAEAFKNNPLASLKANAMPIAGAFGPAILAEMSAKSNMPQTVTKPGMITPYSYFGGQYVAGAPYQATPTKAAGGGLMGMDDGGYSPGQLNFAERSEPVVRMAEGGDVQRFAIGDLVKADIDKAYAAGNYGKVNELAQANKITAADVASTYQGFDASGLAGKGINLYQPPAANVQNLSVIPDNNASNTSFQKVGLGTFRGRPIINPADTETEINNYFTNNQNLVKNKDYKTIASDMYTSGWTPEMVARSTGTNVADVTNQYNQTYGAFDRATQENLVNQKYKKQFGLTDAQLGEIGFGANLFSKEDLPKNIRLNNAYGRYQDELAAAGRYDAPADAYYRTKAIFKPEGKVKPDGTMRRSGRIELVDAVTGEHVTSFGAGQKSGQIFELLDKYGVDPTSFKNAFKTAVDLPNNSGYRKDDYSRLLGYKARNLSGKTDEYLTKPLENITRADLKHKFKRGDEDSKTNVFYLGEMKKQLRDKGLSNRESSDILGQFRNVSGLVNWAEISRSKDPLKAVTGTLNTLQSKGLINRRFAEGGLASLADNIPGYATGGPLDVNNPIYQYFAKPETQALLASGNDAAIAQVLQDKDWKLADVAAATGTQDKLADYSTRFVKSVAAPGTSASEFLAATQDVGLQNQNLATALKNSGLSASAQYALTHDLNDINTDYGGIKGTNFYTDLGYTSGIAPGDQGGLEGLYANIDYAADRLQDQINAGKLTVQQAQNLSLAEMERLGINLADVRAATGSDFANLFKPKKEDKTKLNCPAGYQPNAAGTACVPITSGTQVTTTGVTTPTDIDTAASTALPVGVSGAGITTINPNGTITTRPNIPGIPEGGFTGMKQLRDTYEEGGGSLGVNKNLFAPTTYKEVEDRYPLTGGSKQAMDYLTGKTKYSPVPYTEDGQISKSYAESVMKLPKASSDKMYIFSGGKFIPNPDYAIPTYDSKGVLSRNVTNADVKTFMDKGPSTDAFYTWATTNNLSPEQIALASGRPINEISKLYTGAKELTDEEGKIDQTKVDEKAAKDIETNWDEAAYLAANPSVAEELRTGKSASGKPVLFTSGYDHYLKYGKDQGWKPTVKKAAGGGLMNMVMARGGMAEQYDLGGYSDGGRLLRGPGDGVSDSIPATIGNKRPARLADGEFVVPARIVSELGNGSTEAGARKLYAMMDRVQSARRGTVGKGRVAKNSRSDKYLPA